MLISEIFYSIQGEGSLAGVPSVFIRTSGCNLRCTWCDSPYASWKPEGVDMTTAQILAEVERHPAAFVVITGGEPMIAKGIHELAAALRKKDKHITLETAGTVPPGGITCDLASISPKLANSTPSAALAGDAWRGKHERTRLQTDLLREWCEYCDCQWKFVISSDADARDAESVIAQIGIPIPPHKIMLMPEGTDAEIMRDRTPLLIDWCKRKGWRLSPRLHIEWFGNKRGT